MGVVHTPTGFVDSTHESVDELALTLGPLLMNMLHGLQRLLHCNWLGTEVVGILVQAVAAIFSLVTATKNSIFLLHRKLLSRVY